MSTFTRRSLVRGAAWAVLTAAMAVAAPAVASSSDTIVVEDCSDANLAIVRQSGATDPAVTQVLVANLLEWNNDGGTNVGVSAGIWNIPSGLRVVNESGRTITGFYANPGFCGVDSCEQATTGKSGPADVFPVIGSDGASYDGRVVAYTPYRFSPQTTGAGLSWDFTIATTIPHTLGQALFGNSATTLARVSVPVRLTFLDGLDPVAVGGSTSCCMYLNLSFETTGCLPREASAYSLTSSPLYA